MKILGRYFFLLCFLSKELLPTKAYSDSLGLQGHYGLLPNQYPFIFENPATIFAFSNYFVGEFDGKNASGGFILGEEGALLGIFSGIPTENALNSSSLYGGMFHLGKPKYTPLVNTLSGMDLDAYATNPSYHLGNLQSRVSRLDDPTDLPLTSQNLSIILAFGTKNQSLGILGEIGQTRDREKHEGLGRESMSLFRQSLGLGIGFSTLVSPFAFDGYLRGNLYKIENKFQATGSGGEEISASFESSGSFLLSSGIRLGYTIFKSGGVYFIGKFQLFDHSSLAKAQAHSGSLLPFHKQDTYSRTGYYYEVGLSFLRPFKQDNFAFMGFVWESSKIHLFYDGRNFQEKLYHEEPYEAELTFYRFPLIIGFMARILAYLQIQASLKSQLLAIPQFGYFLKETLWQRPNNQFPDKELKESLTNYQDNLDYAQWQLGISWYLGHVRFDFLSQIELFRRGPNFLSEAQIPFSTQMGITYSFRDLLVKKERKDET